MTHKYTFSFLSITSDKEKCFDQLPDIPAWHRNLIGSDTETFETLDFDLCTVCCFLVV